MNCSEFATDYLAKLQQLLGTIPHSSVEQLITWLAEARAAGATIFVVGNGGSATTASHFATDLGKGASLNLPERFRILSLTDNIGWISALGNDVCYEDIFVEQLRNFARPGDVVVGISVSGNSENVVRSIKWARRNGCRTVALLGKKGGKLKSCADLPILINSDHYGRVEDAHLIITHMVAYYFMESARSNPSPAERV